MKSAPINAYRSQIMGIVTLGVLIVHSSRIISWPHFLGQLFSYGGIGVYIFIYLSGIGLYNSLIHTNCLAAFYKKRLTRVFVPYFIIAFIWYGIKYLLMAHDFINFFFDKYTIILV